jgi:superfamily II DNA/RNA helicase
VRLPRRDADRRQAGARPRLDSIPAGISRTGGRPGTALAGGGGRSLVFTRTKHAARRLARQLTTSAIPAAELHSDLSQGVRERNLASFASGVVRVIVATDIAARGIHVDGIDLVIHADSPAEHKAYLHRSGRTARAGAAGTVITLQTPAQAAAVRPERVSAVGRLPWPPRSLTPRPVLRDRRSSTRRAGFLGQAAGPGLGAVPLRPGRRRTPRR